MTVKREILEQEVEAMRVKVVYTDETVDREWCLSFWIDGPVFRLNKWKGRDSFSFGRGYGEMHLTDVEPTSNAMLVSTDAVKKIDTTSTQTYVATAYVEYETETNGIVWSEEKVVDVIDQSDIDVWTGGEWDTVSDEEYIEGL